MRSETRGEVTPMMPPPNWAALERLLDVARADTHQARYAANFLLAWWNAGDLGGFDLTEAWGLDDALREDLVRQRRPEVLSGAA